MRQNTEVNNGMDVIDSRDVIARIAELESELQDAHESAEADNPVSFENWLKETSEDDAHTLQDAANELKVLTALASEGSDYASDWTHGGALIRDSYFEDYAQELAEDIGAIKSDATWPNDHIDWEAAADALKQDYTSIDFDGVEYWVRS